MQSLLHKYDVVIMNFLIKFISFSFYNRSVYQLSIIHLYVLPFLRPLCLLIYCPQVGFLSWTLSAVYHKQKQDETFKCHLPSLIYGMINPSYLLMVSLQAFLCVRFHSGGWWNPAVISVITQPTASIFNLHFYPSFLLIYDLTLFFPPFPSIFPSCPSLSLWPHIVRIWSSSAAGKFSV